ncbi:hypothetical protein TK49_04015 [Ralstonia mannitolilytica]|uniref:DUF6035 family protein n=1 Tax=Ralstonia mannitolilytica TaxID=105219 RepID=UPI0005D92723|nr:DUF6035 family protein [Ralstonia mannitolilytica]AJW43946.1 hypothetical protein TK49_04015 [Ralstonia mannitolilytica]QIF06321.1 hypothetical protein G5A69_00420 [Ralstonia mannitolilytica]
MATRTIDIVYDNLTHAQVAADTVLEGGTADKHRQRLDDEIMRLENGQRRYTCLYCLESLSIRGSLERVYHFAHPKNPGAECPYRSGYVLTKDQWDALKYNGAKESQAHKQMKAWLVESLRADRDVEPNTIIEDARMQSWLDRSVWRKPDVRGDWRGKTLVFEAQLSTTFISVIAARRQFYLQEGALLFWIFRDVMLAEDVLRFSERDVFYNNNCNLFSVDAESVAASKRENELKLWCRWQEPVLQQSSIQFKWHKKLVGMSQLTLDFDKQRAYFFDFDAAHGKLKAELAARAALPPFRQKELHTARSTSTQDDGRELGERVALQPRYDIMPSELERAWLIASNEPDHFGMLRVQNYTYGVLAPYLHPVCATAPRSLEGRDDLRTILSGLISLRLGRIVGVPSLNWKQLEDRVFRAAFGYYGVFRYAARIYGKFSDIGYDRPESIASTNFREFSERKENTPMVVKRDFDQAFKLLFPELDPARRVRTGGAST